MSYLTPLTFYWGEQPYPAGTTTPGADPQLQFFENFPQHLAILTQGYSNGTLSIMAVNIPLSISFGNVIAPMSISSAALSALSGTLQFGLYSLNGATLSLANSASNTVRHDAQSANSWYSMVTSATQNITPGPWYFGVNFFTGGIATDHSSASFYNSPDENFGNAQPIFHRGRMTVSTNAMPTSIATADLDVTGSDSNKQPYIIITT